eukprot:jgi/Hompol1/6270/HPOL_000321-RA
MAGLSSSDVATQAAALVTATAGLQAGGAALLASAGPALLAAALPLATSGASSGASSGADGEQLQVALLGLIDSVTALLLPPALSRATHADPADLFVGSPELDYAVITSCIEAAAHMFADESIPVRRRLIQTLTNMLPCAFVIFCTTPGDPRYWKILSVLKIQIDSLFIHPNEGIKANAAKYLAQVIVTQTPRDITDIDPVPSLDLIPEGHPYLNPSELLTEAGTLLTKFTTFLSSTNHTASVSTSQKTMEEIILSLGAKPHELQQRVRREAKRTAQALTGNTADATKRQRTQSSERATTDQDPLRIMADRIITNGVQSIPQAVVVDTILTTLGARSMELLVHDLQTYIAQAASRAEAMAAAAMRDPRLRAVAIETGSLAVDGQNPASVALAQGYLTELTSSIQQLIQQTQSKAPQQGAVDQPLLEPAVDEQAAVMPIDVDAILNKPPDLSPEEREEFLSDTLDRILSMESHFEIPVPPGVKPPALIPPTNTSILSARLGWMILAIRVVTRSGAYNDNLRGEFLGFVLSDFRRRSDLAVLWLHEEMLQSHQTGNDTFTVWMDHIIDGLTIARETRDINMTEEDEALQHAQDGAHIDDGFTDEGQAVFNPVDRAFIRFLVDAPDLTEHAIDAVVACCNSEPFLRLGIIALRELIVLRIPWRKQCLKLLLGLCKHSDKMVRSTAIYTAKRFVPDRSAIAPTIIEYALELIDLLPSRTSNDESQPMPSKPKAESSSGEPIPQHTDVIPDVDSEIAPMESAATAWTNDDTFTPEVQTVTKIHINGLLRAMSTSPEKLLSLITTFAPGAEDLALLVIQVLLKTEHAADAIAQTIAVYEARQLDVRFLIIIMPQLEK